MKGSYFDLMRQPMATPQRLVKLLQEQQLDTVQTSVKALGCRDPMTLASMQQEYIARTLQRWTTLAGDDGAAPPPTSEKAENRPAASSGSASKPAAQPVATLRAGPHASAVGDVAQPAPAEAPKRPAPATQPLAQRDDDLTQIKGIGPKFAQTLKDHGITSYAKLASLTAAEIEALEEKLGFSGRFERENWVEQARALIAH